MSEYNDSPLREREMCESNDFPSRKKAERLSTSKGEE